MDWRQVRKALKEADIWMWETIRVPSGWNACDYVAWRSNRSSSGGLRNHDNPATREMFETEGEPVTMLDAVDYEFDEPTALFEFPDGSVFGVNAALVKLTDGLELHGIRTAGKAIMLAGIKDGRNEILIAERRVQ